MIDRRASNLLPRTTPFFGRAVERAAIERAFVSGAQLVTLLGPPGVGKTSVAREYAQERLADALPGGVWLCDLTEARDRDDLAGALGGVLGVVLRGAQPSQVEQLGDAIAARGHILLLLDNFEGLVEEGTPLVERWLSMAPLARWLVTSRERLRVQAEQCVEVPPLSVPAPDEVDPDVVGSAEAVQLFLERARRTRSDFAMTAAEAPSVAGIVRRLDGLPLAIELAAARMGLLSPAQLLAQLHDRFEALGHGPRTAPERHATLGTAIRHSWDLLSRWEQEALAECSVFHGGWNLRSAEAVLDLRSSGAPAGPAAVIEILQSLVDRSLVVTESVAGLSERRYRLLESIRSFAQEELRRGGLEEATLERLGAYFASECRRWARAIEGPRGIEVRQQIAAETDNLLALCRAAQSRPPSSKGTTTALQVLVALSASPSPANPGRYLDLLDRMIERARDPGVDREVHVRALLARATILRHSGRTARSVEDVEAARALLGEPAEGPLAARVHAALGFAYTEIARLVDARAALDRATWLLDRDDDPWLRALVAFRWYFLSDREGSAEDALGWCRAALDLFRGNGDPFWQGQCHASLADVLRDAGRWAEAEDHLAQAADLLGGVGGRLFEAQFLCREALILQDRGRLDEARARLARAVVLDRHAGERLFEGVHLVRLASVELQMGAFAEAYEHGEQASALLAGPDPASSALGAATAGAAAAALGRIERARELLDGAARLAASVGARWAEAIVELDRAHLDLAIGGEAGRRSAQDRLRRIDTQGDLNYEEVRSARRALERALGEKPAVSRPVADEALVVSRGGFWFRPPGGKRVSLRRREALGRVLVRLAHARETSPGEPVSVEDLLASGWPEERVTPRAGAMRVWNALSTLRKLGLVDKVATVRRGYFLDPAVPFEWAADGEA